MQRAYERERLDEPPVYDVLTLLRRRAGRVAGTGAAVLLGALGASVPTVATAGTWSAALPGSVIIDSAATDSGAAIEDGRVWSARLQYEQTAPYRVAGAEVGTRPLDGGAEGRTVLDFAAVTRPTGAFVAFDSAEVRTFRVRDGRVYLLGTWFMKDTSDDPTKGDVPSGLTFVAVFDGTTGALLRQEQLSKDGPTVTGTPVLFLSGTPAVLTTSADLRLEYPLLDPWTSVPLPFPAAADAHVVGRFALVPSPQSGGSISSWSDGSGTLRVVEVATGRILYRLTARRVTRAAGAPRDARPDVTLMADGSLGVAMPTGGRTVHPVAVDPEGRIVRVGRALRRTTSVAAALQGTRAFVGLEATERVRGKARDTRGLWLVDRRGRRGYPISTARHDGLKRVSLLPFWSDGERALWGTTSPKGQKVGLAAVTATSRIVLRRTATPTAGRAR